MLPVDLVAVEEEEEEEEESGWRRTAEEAPELRLSALLPPPLGARSGRRCGEGRAGRAGVLAWGGR